MLSVERNKVFRSRLLYLDELRDSWINDPDRNWSVYAKKEEIVF